MFGMHFSVVGQPAVDPSGRPVAAFQMVTPGYYDTFGVRVIRGRSFDDRDAATGARVAMVNEELANRYFAGVDPLTQRIAVGELIPSAIKPGPPVEWQVIGVFHNVRPGLRNTYAEIDVPFWQSPWPRASMAVRTDGDPNGLINSIASAVTRTCLLPA